MIILARDCSFFVKKLKDEVNLFEVVCNIIIRVF